MRRVAVFFSPAPRFFSMKLPLPFRSAVLACTLVATSFAAGTGPTLADFQAQAARSNLRLELPDYPRTADEISNRTTTALAAADAALLALASQHAGKASFVSTFGAFEEITGRVSTWANHIGTLAESHPDKSLRDIARDAGQRIEAWGIALEYREDLYRVLQRWADTKPALDAQQQRLVDFTLRDFRRAGLALPPAERQQVELLRKSLSELERQFDVNINEARAPLDFTAEELAGVPAALLNSPGVKQPDGRYRVMANITWHVAAVQDNADNAEVRRRVTVARGQLAREKNIPVLAKLVALRAEIARRLGYATWAEFRTETRMTGSAAVALKFEEDLVKGLQPKFVEEVETLRQLKAAHTGLADSRIEAWDTAYYTNKLRKEKYAVDTEALRVFFAYEPTLRGMFAIYEKVFALKFTQIEPPYVWAPGVQLWIAADAGSGEPIGAFYLDMFPREGKYNHNGHFRQNMGCALSAGGYQLPVSVLLCNFPPPTAGKPSLLSHDNVKTLFHEFGHVMHNLLGRARYSSLNYAGVPKDFIEAPSQMLENWVWNKAVLDTFAADYRDPTKKIPAETIDAMIRAREATEGVTYRRQLSLGLMDLGLHTLSPGDAWTTDVVKLSNDVSARVSITPAPDTAFVAYFGHLTGYDAGYYGYLWAKVMASDMASVFEAAPDRYFDETIGRRLRDEVYAAGNTRDVAESVDKFLGRPRSQKAFLQYVGIKE
ncbi:MAG: thimet oligopeptidase [Verrucomicrobiota bacterium]|nr:thimet oligopeptidase [Verrucomicrobiota bacterium]